MTLKPYSINCNGRLFALDQPQVMGIINVTPDSFYADSRKQSDEAIAARARQIVAEGGTMIDIGAYSSRPGADEVSVEEEMERLRHGLAIVNKEAPDLEAGTFAIAGMGALLAASIRAPLTGIILVLEMTDNYQLILPMIITGLGATLLAQFTGGKPLYSAILARTLAKQEAEQLARSKAASASENT